MPPPRRLWDSCTIIYYLAGKAEDNPECPEIIAQAKRGELEIMVSMLAEAEVAKVDDELGPGDDSESMIREFFGRSYIVRVALEVEIAREARRLVRVYKGMKPLDAVHIATALRYAVPILETYDAEMLKRTGQEGEPPLIIRKPDAGEPPSTAKQGNLFGSEGRPSASL